MEFLPEERDLIKYCEKNTTSHILKAYTAVYLSALSLLCFLGWEYQGIVSFIESLRKEGLDTDISNLSLDLKGQEMPSSVSEEETKMKMDCLQPRGVP